MSKALKTGKADLAARVEASLEMQLRALEQGFKKMLGSRV